MKYRVALAALSAPLLSVYLGAAGGSCLPRALTPAEKTMGANVAAQLRVLLPATPPGWKISDEDLTDISAGSCLSSVTKKMVPQPVSVLVRRKFLRVEPVSGTAPATPAPAVSAPPDAKAEARAVALEQQITALKLKETDANRSYTAARVKGDSEAQRTAIQNARGYRKAQEPLLEELTGIRSSQRLQRSAESKASTDAAFARARQELANRRVASVSLLVNSDQAAVRGAKAVSIADVDLALRDPGGTTHLLFGNWKQFGYVASSPFDGSLPTTRVQNVILDISGSDAVTEMLLKGLDLKSVRKVMVP